MTKVKIAVIGAGNRGKDRYGEYGLMFPDQIEFIAVAEPIHERRNGFCKKHNISPEYAFTSWEQLLAKEKFCNGIIIATQDDQHFEPAKLAIEKGYHVLLEKPMSNLLHECIELGEIAKKSNRLFMICHVLRYNPLFSNIKKIISDGQIGQVISIQHSENIGYYHMAHSFVRGNWRNDQDSCPIILAKSCHDMDILLWLVEKKCTKISSYGSLSYFRPERAPSDAGERCMQCDIEQTCPYSAIKLYFNHIGQWPTTVITELQTKEGVTQALNEGPYGKCVFKCDNNVCDHQVTIMEFEGGTTASFHLCAFTDDIHRTIKIMGTEGQIYANDIHNEIEITRFGYPKKNVKIDDSINCYDHENYGILEDFITSIKKDSNQTLTSAEISVESHLMAFAAEESRLTNQSICLDSFSKKNLYINKHKR